ncbi:TlpA disulfide reductase family protein [Telluribacter sp. SYSU D00476]|uniref:TlpA family protein disulfide reductase n=1 Tax=Telluribacter sp. SYSU D00476 TaxID=2811430 RepID=UPI001FF406E4|nr:TlpA disulfide reductase family protein [Telluribacter sp. SYSU D00476]
MKRLLVGFCFLLMYHAKAQSGNKPKEDPILYFNSFQKFVNESLKQDSALYYIQKLASNSAYEPLLKGLIHDSFALQLRQRDFEKSDTSKINAYNRRLLFSKGLLQKMALDSNKVLQQSVRPLYLLSKAQDNHTDPVALTALTHEFIQKELLPGSLYENRQGRYGLLIHQILAKQEATKPLAHDLLLTIKTKLEGGQTMVTDSTSRTELEKRAWYRYLYAYANYIEAGETRGEATKVQLLKNAFDYSPDLVDQNHAPAYFYDMIMLTGGEKASFRDDYFTFLESRSTNKKEVLAALLNTALIAPEYKSRLETFYTKNLAPEEPFANYWRTAINRTAKAAPSISFTLLDGNPFVSNNLSGKWILVDFWGTWCGPCRQEHPGLDKFYQSTVLQRSDTIALLTVACRDTKDKVSAYMEQKKFTFPVAMSDGKIENIYKVQAYPTKVLITPEGKYITVPFGVDWVGFVKHYVGI